MLKKYRLLRHVIFWSSLLLFFSVYFSYYNQDDTFFRVFITTLFQFFLDITWNCFIIYVLFPTYLFKNKYFKFSLILFICFVAYLFITFPYDLLILKIFYSNLYEHVTLSRFIHARSLYTVVIELIIMMSVSLFVLIKKLIISIEAGNKFKEEKLKAEIKWKESELNYLKSQIHPHFLFNVFNNIDELIYINRDKASETLSHLSESLRYLLHDSSKDFVLVENEIHFIQSYLKVASISFADPGFIQFKFDSNCNDRKIAPLIFIPYIENAVKHCNRKVPAPGISVIIICTSDFIELECRNYRKKNNTVKKQEGIGLSNVQKRLDLIYPESYILDIFEENGEFVSRLKIFIK